LDTLDLPNGCAVVEIPTHVIKDRKYQFEFEARHIRESPTLYIDNINHSCGFMK